MESRKELLESINEIYESVKELTKAGSCGEYSGQADYEDARNLVDQILNSPIVGSLLNIFWQRTSDSCPLECTEAENQESDFREWVKTIDFDKLVEMHDR